ncbi:GNAT family N-acetyltransferase [Cellulophaga baltica]|uniref:GNAT family N-acetyltransferase n=1 Tax=Cellulophaga TaxID=104264 RepID=UPI001C06DEA6|nr:MULTISPECIES: GNAT family protein [Cellulophaga]MBU2996447.1 GNAT family N-acetyltransferase [Cellulophaga baltica]MDO6767841.1 GNAT family protein [Cellulophaga sp. 1_MG-2023]
MNIAILNSTIQLENDRVKLIPFESERNEELKEIIFSPEIWKYMGTDMKTEKDFENYVTNTLKDQKNGICYPFLIIDKKNNKVAESTRYGYLNSISQKCEIGWTWYGTEFQGTGLNKSCKFELLKFGFESIGFRRIQFSADQENLKSQKAIEKLGAKKEGIFRNNYIAPNGESRNDVYYSIIKEDWNALRVENFREFLSR